MTQSRCSVTYCRFRFILFLFSHDLLIVLFNLSTIERSTNGNFIVNIILHERFQSILHTLFLKWEFWNLQRSLNQLNRWKLNHVIMMKNVCPFEIFCIFFIFAIVCGIENSQNSLNCRFRVPFGITAGILTQYFRHKNHIKRMTLVYT